MEQYLAAHRHESHQQQSHQQQHQRQSQLNIRQTHLINGKTRNIASNSVAVNLLTGNTELDTGVTGSGGCLRDYSMVVPDNQLDFYKQAMSRGLDQPQYRAQLQRFLRTGFRQAVTQLPDLDPAISSGLVFPKQGNKACFNYMSQFLRQTLLKLVQLCLPPSKQDRQVMDRLPGLHKMDNPGAAYLAIYKRVFDALLLLDSKDVVLWFFFQAPNYINFNISGYRQVYETMLDYALVRWSHDAIASGFSLERSDIQSNPRLRYEVVTRASTLYYNLVYHGQSNAVILHKLAQLQRRIYPQLEYVANHCQIDRNWRPNAALPLRPARFVAANGAPELVRMLDLFNNERGSASSGGNSSSVQAYIDKKWRLRQPDGSLVKLRRIKVCFISDKLMAYTSVFRDRIGVISGLDPRYFEVWVAVWSPIEKLERSTVVQHFLGPIHKSKHIIRLHRHDLLHNQSTIAKHEFDMIIYPDLGMHQDATLLAHARLAPVQATTWGHSDTSGNPSVDYYFTSQLFEQTKDLAIPRSNYTEAPILMQSSGTYYYSPRKIASKYFRQGCEEFFLNKKELGFPANAIVIGCLHSFYKFNPDFEQVLGHIMNRAAKELQRPVYLALSNSIPFNKAHLARLNQMLGKHCDTRVKWFQNKAPHEWLNLVSVCDIMLDPFPFGGCNTTLEAFDFGRPVVCWPSKRMMPGRFTQGFYQIMGLEKVGCCANSSEEYIDATMRLLKDGAFYKFVSDKIIERRERLFEDPSTVREYEQLIARLVRMHLPHTN